MTSPVHDKKRSPFALIGLVFFVAVSACATAPPTSSSARAQGEAMVAAADPRAVDAGLQMLREGGTATDAAIATMMVLGLVEPQSAGVGGGGFMLAYDGATHHIAAYDGREMAPAGATPALFLDPQGRPLQFLDAVASGRSIGGPSLIAMLKLAHQKHGRLPWAHLFEPAIALAEHGFAVSPRLNGSLTNSAMRLRDDPAARAYFFQADGSPLPAGFIRTNPDYAQTLRRIAAEGPDALTHGAIAHDIVATAQRGPGAGALTEEDLRAYRPRELAPICGSFRVYRVCGMPPPSSGGEAILAILGLYDRARPNPVGPANPDDWAAFLWASRLSYADRDYYLGDDSMVPVPLPALIAPAYLDQRARRIDLTRAPQGTLPPGDPSTVVGGQSLIGHWGRDATHDVPGTTHMSIVDGEGNAVALTASIENAFGAQRMTHGFLLNNQLTDFSFSPQINGLPVANAVAPHKRPRSSMAPTIVTDQNGALVEVIGSPGGSGIIAYVARTLIGTLAWSQSMQDAIAVGNVVAANPTVRAEAARLPPSFTSDMSARGWSVQEITQEASGLHGILVTPHGLDGGADPRREGVAVSLPPN